MAWVGELFWVRSVGMFDPLLSYFSQILLGSLGDVVIFGRIEARVFLMIWFGWCSFMCFRVPLF